jgi:hypothetical protein
MAKRTRGVYRLPALAALLLACGAGCAPRDAAKAPGAKGPPQGGSPAQSAAARRAPSDEQCRQFAMTLEQAVRAGDAAAYQAPIDIDAILAAATRGVEGAEKSKRGFAKGVKQTFHAQNDFGRRVVEAVQGGGSYRLLRVHDKGAEKLALFRMVLAGGGVNYHDMTLALGPDGKVRAADVYVFLTAEKLSETLRRSFLPLAAEESKSLLAKLTGAESDFIKNIDKFGRIPEAIAAGRYREALDIYYQLPPSLRKDKSFLLLRLQAAMHAGDQAYLAAIRDFRAYHPHDPCVDIISIDKFILGKQYREASQAIDRLDAAVGGDPYLNVIRGNLHLLQNETGPAKAFAEKTLKADDTLIDAHWLLVSAALQERAFGEVTRFLRRIDEKFDVEFFDLETVPEYAEYVKSPEYQDWLKSRPPGP